MFDFHLPHLRGQSTASMGNGAASGRNRVQLRRWLFAYGPWDADIWDEADAGSQRSVGWAVEDSVGPWANGRFGERAVHVCKALVGALHQALTDAQDAQKISKAKLLFPFGSTQATRRYECVVNALKELDGVQIIKPKGAPLSLTVREPPAGPRHRLRALRRAPPRCVTSTRPATVSARSPTSIVAL